MEVIPTITPTVSETTEASGTQAAASGSQRYLLQVNIGTDQGVVEEEDLSLLGLENLTFITIDNFSEQFTLN